MIDIYNVYRCGKILLKKLNFGDSIFGNFSAPNAKFTIAIALGLIFKS